MSHTRADKLLIRPGHGVRAGAGDGQRTSPIQGTRGPISFRVTLPSPDHQPRPLAGDRQPQTHSQFSSGVDTATGAERMLDDHSHAEVLTSILGIGVRSRGKPS